jgi:hypothetical protein
MLGAYRIPQAHPDSVPNTGSGAEEVAARQRRGL